ncbi:MAG: DUF4129 domain-containing protein [Planctomycetes bacterium]|nr:DUF4129 domain-containing protein [Planctomycetota bacterium]
MTRPDRRAPLLGLVVGLFALAGAPGAARGDEGPAPAHDLTHDEVARALEAVLDDPALREGLRTSHMDAAAAGDVLAEGTSRLWDAFRRWAARLAREHPVLYVGLFAVMLLALVPLLLHLGWSLALAFRRGARAAPGDAEADDPAARRRRSAELRAEARAFAAGGDLRQATRALLLAFLALLEERRSLAVAGSWTNREVLARLRVDPAARARLARFVAAADAACYGDQGPGRDVLDEGEALLLELERGGALGGAP